MFVLAWALAAFWVSMSSCCLISSLNVHLTKHTLGLNTVLTQPQCLQCLWGGDERSRWQQNNAISTSIGGHRTAWWSLMQHNTKSSSGVPFVSCANPLPERPVGVDRFAPWRLQRDTVWRAWEGEQGCHSGQCWEGSLRLEVRGHLMVWAWWPRLSSWPPAVCSPWLQFWRWHLGCPTRPICPKTPVPALPSLDVRLTLVLPYNKLQDKPNTETFMFTLRSLCKLQLHHVNHAWFVKKL